jgi:hypothetical protein
MSDHDTAAQLAGAAAFDATMQRIGEVSAATFDRDGAEDWRAMVDVLHEALQGAMVASPEFRFGFLMPLADMLDCQRLGLTNAGDWTALGTVRKFAQTQEASHG